MIRICTKFIIGFFVALLLLIYAFVVIDWLNIAKDCYKIHNLYMPEKTERTDFDLQYDKNLEPIVIDGCSFTYGDSIKIEETFGYKLQKMTKRKVYNYGMSGHGVQHILYRVQNMQLTDNNEEPKYFIYTYINDHLRRMLCEYNGVYHSEKRNIFAVKHNRIVPKSIKITPMDYLKITSLWQSYRYGMFNAMSYDQKFDIFELYMKELQNSLHKKFPNTKLVIVVYYPTVDSHGEEATTDRWTELEQEGIIVIRFDSQKYSFLEDKEYISNLDNVHPNGKAWNIITPIVVKNLNL